MEEKEIEKLTAEIEKLRIELEKFNSRPNIQPYYPPQYIPPNYHNPALHYHNGMPCYQNPCVWC
jgi:hypothetical protein